MGDDPKFLELKGIIKSILISAPSGLPLNKLQADYQDSEGSPIPYRKYGFSSVEDLLRSMPDAVAIQRRQGNVIYHGVADQATAHVKNLVANQKTSKPYSSMKRQDPPSHQRKSCANNHNATYAPYTNRNRILKQQEEEADKNIKKLENTGLSESVELNVKTFDSDSSVYLSATESMTNCLNSSHIPKETKDNLQYLLNARKNGMPIEMVIPLYKAYFQKPLKITELGFGSLVEMATSLSDICTLRKSGNDVLIFPINEGKSKVSDKVESSVMLQLVARLKTVLSMYPGGVQVTKLSQIYAKEFPTFQSDMNYADFGYPSLIHLLKALPSDDFNIIISKEFHYPIIGLKSHMVTPFISSELTKARSTNENFVHVGEHYNSVDINCEVSSDGLLEVLVQEIYNPHLFYVVLRHEKYYVKLEELNVDITTFYENQEVIEKYRLKREHCVLEQPVIILYSVDNNLYRAVITDLCGSDLVQVFLIDYGTIAKVKYTEMLYLDRKFFDFPAQAVQASLWGVGSGCKTGNWRKGCLKRFHQLVSEKSLFAHIKHIKGNNIKTVLYDTTGDGDININERLIKEQHCIEVKEEDDVDLVEHLSTLSESIKDLSTDNIVEEIEKNSSPPLSVDSGVADTATGLDASTLISHSAASPVFTFDQLLKIRDAKSTNVSMQAENIESSNYPYKSVVHQLPAPTLTDDTEVHLKACLSILQSKRYKIINQMLDAPPYGNIDELVNQLVKVNDQLKKILSVAEDTL